MIVYPACKINLGLHILEKRADGYHNLETIFYPVALTDILEIIENKEPENSPSFPLSTSGLPIQGTTSSNLCVKAYKLLKKDFPKLPWVRVHIHKVIPIGAGLGGGSSNGAFALKVYNELFNLGISEKKLLDYAAILGSDCPFFIINKPCYATGRGEILNTTDLDLSGYKFVMVNPGIYINTGDAFRDIKPRFRERAVTDIIKDPIETWKNELTNDFTGPVYKKYPELLTIEKRLYDAGASYACMSGSGSTVYGLFKKEAAVELSFPPQYFVRTLHS